MNRRSEDGGQAAALAAVRRVVLVGEHLARSRSVDAVLDAVVEHIPVIAGVYSAVAYLDSGGGELRPRAPRDRITHLRTLDRSLTAGIGQALYTHDLLERSPWFAVLGDLLVPCPQGRLACVDIGSRGLIVLVERRADRELDPEQWYHVGCVARQADAALERIELEQRARATAERTSSVGTAGH